MKRVGFFPEGILVNNGIIYAMVPPGEVTMELWLECLADRVQMMLDSKIWFKRSLPNKIFKSWLKRRLANKICKQLDFPRCRDLNQFGHHIIAYESIFKNYIIASFDKGMNPFPQIAIEQDEGFFDGVHDDLQVWAILAWFFLTYNRRKDQDWDKEQALKKDDYIAAKNDCNLKRVAWSPKGIEAPIELLAVMVPLGKLTEKAWIKALADRVSEMAVKDNEFRVDIYKACTILHIPSFSDPFQLGKHILKKSLLFKSWIKYSISDQSIFPVKVVEEDEDARVAIESTDFATWIDLLEKITIHTLPNLKTYIHSRKEIT